MTQKMQATIAEQKKSLEEQEIALARNSACVVDRDKEVLKLRAEAAKLQEIVDQKDSDLKDMRKQMRSERDHVYSVMSENRDLKDEIDLLRHQIGTSNVSSHLTQNDLLNRQLLQSFMVNMDSMNVKWSDSNDEEKEEEEDDGEWSS
eukprot:TRINITY_DN22318_c0_g1_i1.p1 TRINITY_DN22318_c0_g1~~TRINITY_DN22318_c0_g1_i1.p1  ORF type:complete len:164 (+),score=55.82 TRINITY_DN22318_c0_g1_i1:54-494(+)